MTDIHSTQYRYESIAEQFNVEPNDYILKMFDRDKQETIIDTKENLYLCLAGNNKLLCDKRLTDDDIHILCVALENNFYVSHLDLRYNEITDKGAAYIAELIKGSHNLKEVNLMFNDIGPEGGVLIAKSLEQNESLTSLQMTGNKIGNQGGMYFAQALQVNKRLEKLDLGDTDLTTESVIALATVLHNNQHLISLNVNRPLLFSHQEETTVHFAGMLKVNSTLEELYLQKYDLRDFGASRLAENLIYNCTLRHLDLSSNRITRDGVQQLAKVLEKNTSLKSLDLGNNRLEDDGAIYLADALSMYNNSLKSLSVVSNNIGSKGLCALADALKTNSALTYIYIWGNNLEESACIAFSNLIDTSRLECQDTDIQPYNVDGVTYLAQRDNHPNRHYYYAPYYGDDVPKWMPKSNLTQRFSSTYIERKIRNDFTY